MPDIQPLGLETKVTFGLFPDINQQPQHELHLNRETRPDLLCEE